MGSSDAFSGLHVKTHPARFLGEWGESLEVRDPGDYVGEHRTSREHGGITRGGLWTHCFCRLCWDGVI